MTPITDAALDALASDFAARLREDVPEWTDPTSDDPGVTLLEVFAFLTEQLVFRSNQLPDRGRRAIARTMAALGTLCSRGLEPIDGLTRVNYFSGQSLTAGDFQTEQDYFRAKHRRHNRMLLGAGIVTGLEVALDSSSSDDRPVVSIGAGCAIAPDGEELSLPAPLLCRLCATASSGFVTLRYVERLSEPIGTTTESEGRQASRIQEGAIIGFAESMFENAIALAKLERETGTWHVVASFRVPRASLASARN